MSFQWIDYLTLAKELLELAKKIEQINEQQSDLNTYEAMLRSCISRAYYASYHVAAQYLQDEKEYDLKGSNEGSHWKVIDLLQKDKDSKIRYVGKSLLDLRNARTRADYRLSCRELKTIKLVTNEAREALRISYGIIKTLNFFLEKKLDILK